MNDNYENLDIREALTKKQQKVLNCIKKSVTEKGYSPSVRELCEMTGLTSTSTIHSYLTSLQKKGYIRRDPSKPRTIEILDTGDDVFVLNVKDNNMINAGIVLGDRVTVKKQSRAEDGDIIVSIFNGEVTIARYFKDNNACKLQFASEGSTSIVLDNVTILGKVVGISRAV